MPAPSKLAKSSVDYSKGLPQAHCSICAHFRAGSGTCTIVEGAIEPDYWCEKFKREATRRDYSK